MKMEFWLLILVLCHATNSIESVNSPQNNVKLYKTFDEIFGEGWDDEEKLKLLGPNESQRMEASPTENRHETSLQNEQNESEKSPVQTEHNELDGFDEVQEADELFDSNEQNNQKNSEKYGNKTIYSDDQKREIVQEYIKLKNQHCQKGDVSKKEWNKFNANAAKKLGVRYNIVCRWQKRFGIDKKVKRCYDDRKREIIQQLIELKNKFSQEKQHSHNEWNQFYANIPKELGVSHTTISRWKKQFFGGKINNIKKYTDEQKQEKMKKYYEIKLRNPTIKDTDIAADLKISHKTLIKWKAKFKNVPELNMSIPSSTKSYSDDRKREIVQEFIKLKNKFKQEKKHSYIEWKQFEANIIKELGVGHSTIFKWQKQFFGGKINNIKKYTDEQKQEKLKEYYEIKIRNPTVKDRDIAPDLKISI